MRGRPSSPASRAAYGARKLYEDFGFVPTGQWEPLREGMALQIELLRLRP